MNLTITDRAANATLTDRLESRRKAQVVLFQDRLAKLAETDTEAFITYALYVLPPQFWTLVDDLKQADVRLSKRMGVRLTDQLGFFRDSLVRSIISAMLYREPLEAYPVKLLEVMSDIWRTLNPLDKDNPLETIL